MVTTRSSPRKKQPKTTDVEADREVELDEGDDLLPEDATIVVKDGEVTGKKLEPTDANPPKLFILPKDSSREAKIVTLLEPSRGIPSRYLVCPEKGVHEFTQVAAPKSEPRSVLIAPGNGGKREVSLEADELRKGDISKGYIAESPNVFVATPVDPIFLLVPMLAPASNKNQKRLFLTLDDHVDSTEGTLRQLLRQDSIRKLFESRLDSVCDVVEAGDESMYRLSTDKLASLLISKAGRMVAHGLPASMEEKFIRQALQAPILSVKREDTQVATTTTEIQPGTAEDSQTSSSETSTQKDATLSQVSVMTSMTSITIPQDEDVLPEIPTNEPSAEIKQLLRLRTALNYMQSCYLPTHIRVSLSTMLVKLVDFTPLDEHLKHLESLHEEARALRSLSDNITRKRGMEDDDEAVEERAEKKRKKDEEEKRKKQESNALKQLKKADTTGMKKLSSFFTKVPKKV